MESMSEIQINAGNMAYRLWQCLPEPKLDYVQWYYGKRRQSLSEALEGSQSLISEEGSDGTDEQRRFAASPC